MHGPDSAGFIFGLALGAGVVAVLMLGMGLVEGR